MRAVALAVARKAARYLASRMTLLLVEQNDIAALGLANRGYVLKTGTISLSGTGEELLANDRVRFAHLGI